MEAGQVTDDLLDLAGRLCCRWRCRGGAGWLLHSLCNVQPTAQTLYSITGACTWSEAAPVETCKLLMKVEVDMSKGPCRQRGLPSSSEEFYICNHTHELAQRNGQMRCRCTLAVASDAGHIRRIIILCILSVPCVVSDASSVMCQGIEGMCWACARTFLLVQEGSR